MCYCTVDYPHCTKWISVLLQRKRKSLFSKEENKKWISVPCLVGEKNIFSTFRTHVAHCSTFRLFVLNIILP
jgi:hypothetical protein